MKILRLALPFAAAAVLTVQLPCFAQDPPHAVAISFHTPFVVFEAPAGDKPVAPEKTTAPLSGTAAPQQGRVAEKIDRWMDVTELSFSSRYRSEKASDDFEYIANAQQRSVAAGRFKADAAGRYTLNYRVSSGQTFNWAYSDMIGADFASREGPGTAYVPLPVLEKLFVVLGDGYSVPVVGSRGWEMSPRQFYVAATPVDGFTAEYGSLAIERGKGTEITTYDDDGYLTGERIRLSDPHRMFFNEISITYAFEGDIFNPSFMDRTQHLKKSNYHQFLFVKDISPRVGVSADYTFDKKTHTLREAGTIKVPETKVLDSLRVELYQRLNMVHVGPLALSAGSGFGVTAERTLFARVKLDGGYEEVDAHYGATVDNVVAAFSGFSMNGDSYSTGKHVFAHATVKVTPFASLFGFYIHQTDAPAAGEFGLAKQGFNGGLTIDLKKLVNSKEKVM